MNGNQWTLRSRTEHFDAMFKAFYFERAKQLFTTRELKRFL